MVFQWYTREKVIGYHLFQIKPDVDGFRLASLTKLKEQGSYR